MQGIDLPYLAIATEQQLTDWTYNDTSSLFIVFYTGREGGADFARGIEHGHYPPGTPANRSFDILMYNWMEFPWWIIRMPLRDRAIADQVAESQGLRLANGVPHMVKGGEKISHVINVRKPPSNLTVESVFPLRSRRTFVLEKKHPASAGRGVPVDILFGGDRAMRTVAKAYGDMGAEALADMARRCAERN